MTATKRDPALGPPGERGSSTLVAAAAAALVALIVLGATSQALQGVNPLRDVETLGLLGFAAFGVVGLLVYRREPWNALGWIWCLTGIAAVGSYTADQYAQLSIDGGRHLPGELLAAWIQNWLWFAPIPPVFIHTFLLFPNGRPPSHRWRVVLWGGTGATLGLIGYFALLRAELDGYPRLANPTGLIPESFSFVAGALLLLLVVCTAASVASLIVRYRRARAQGRQQIKIITIAALAMVVILGTGGLSPAGNSEALADLMFGISVLLFPTACGIAIVRHRLFDVDVVINRTLVYLLLTAMLAGTYLVCILVMQRVLPLGSDSDVAVAASTLAVAALFRPLRARVQRTIDRRFYRRKYDAERTLAEFGTRMRQAVDLETLTSDVLSVVQTTVQPTRAALWLRTVEAPVRRAR